MTVYLDTSSLVKLYVEEEGSDDVAEMVAEADVLVTSAVAYAECRAGLARRRRERALRPADHRTLVVRFDADWPGLSALEVTEPLARRAGELADRFALRGFDAIHLASFELVLERAVDLDEVKFSTADTRLANAARRLV